MVYIILILLIILIIFYSLNCILKQYYEKQIIQENYTGLSTNDLVSSMKSMYIVDESKKTVKKCNKSLCQEKSYAKHFNTVDAIALAKDKFRTSSALIKSGISVPKFIKISNKSVSNIIQQMNAQKIGYPIVLKPVNGTFGIDVITDIDNKKELEESLAKLTKYNELMLEEQVSGDCYRIFVFNGKIIDIIKREKPYIIGNGHNTVKELIDKRNKEQLAMNLPQTKNVSDLFLAKQGYQIDTIPDDGKKIYISNVINMHNGARISRIDINTIPKINQKMFIETNRALNITCSGIDFLSEDITVDYNINNGKVLEVNGTPDTEIHTKIKFNDGETFWNKVSKQIF